MLWLQESDEEGGRMWSGFSSEIETHTPPTAEHLAQQCRMWSGFSSEIETRPLCTCVAHVYPVACGAASHLRLKLVFWGCGDAYYQSRMWSGFSSEIETMRRGVTPSMTTCRMWSGFSSEIETLKKDVAGLPVFVSHVERLLI